MIVNDSIFPEKSIEYTHGFKKAVVDAMNVYVEAKEEVPECINVSHEGLEYSVNWVNFFKNQREDLLSQIKSYDHVQDILCEKYGKPKLSRCVWSEEIRGKKKNSAGGRKLKKDSPNLEVLDEVYVMRCNEIKKMIVCGVLEMWKYSNKKQIETWYFLVENYNSPAVWIDEAERYRSDKVFESKKKLIESL